MLDCAETTGESSFRQTQLSLSLEGFYLSYFSPCCEVCSMFNAGCLLILPPVERQTHLKNKLFWQDLIGLACCGLDLERLTQRSIQEKKFPSHCYWSHCRSVAVVCCLPEVWTGFLGTHFWSKVSLIFRNRQNQDWHCWNVLPESRIFSSGVVVVWHWRQTLPWCLPAYVFLFCLFER